MFLCLERLLFKISASQIYIQLLLHFPRLLLSRRGPPFRARRFSSRETPPPPSRPLPSLPLSPSASLPLSLPASRCAGPAPPPPLPRAKRWLGDDAPGQRRRRPRPRPVPVPGHGAARRAPPVAVGLPTLPSLPLSPSASLSLSPGVEVAGRRRPRAAPASAPAAACACPRPWLGEASPTGGRRTAYPRRCLLCLLRVCSYATSATGTLPAFATGTLAVGSAQVSSRSFILVW